ncbi:aromatic ring-opening dioxygenase [Paraphaeosphaeria sporulosa]
MCFDCSAPFLKYIRFSVLLPGLSIPLLCKRQQAIRVEFSLLPLHTTMTTHTQMMPVYFLGIGGPNFMENTHHPAYAQLTSIGNEITTRVKPKAIVVFSAHWQGGHNSIAINVAEETDIIYDFYGFPKYYYEFKYPSKGSPALADKVATLLEKSGVKIEKVKRGLDHGVWVGFAVAFDPKKNPLHVPIVQHYRLGQALQSLRQEGILIIGAGMAVHNLYDFRATRGTGRTMPYVSTFDDALKEAATTLPEDREAKMAALLNREDARKAAPTLEHLLPMYVVAGAASNDTGERLWTLAEGSLSWAQYRFGKVPGA